MGKLLISSICSKSHTHTHPRSWKVAEDPALANPHPWAGHAFSSCVFARKTVPLVNKDSWNSTCRRYSNSNPRIKEPSAYTSGTVSPCQHTASFKTKYHAHVASLIAVAQITNPPRATALRKHTAIGLNLCSKCCMRLCRNRLKWLRPMMLLIIPVEVFTGLLMVSPCPIGRERFGKGTQIPPSSTHSLFCGLRKLSLKLRGNEREMSILLHSRVGNRRVSHDGTIPITSEEREREIKKKNIHAYIYIYRYIDR